jgi:chaperonin cofactor prefoldin
LLAVTAAWAKSIEGDVEHLKHQAAVLETQHESIAPRLQRIEEKIDRLYLSGTRRGAQ